MKLKRQILLFLDETPPQLSCPQSYVIELVNKQDNYVVNFNETRRRINVSDASGEVTLAFNPDRASIAIGDFENVTVTATDKFGNKAFCYFQVRTTAITLFSDFDGVNSGGE